MRAFSSPFLSLKRHFFRKLPPYVRIILDVFQSLCVELPVSMLGVADHEIALNRQIAFVAVFSFYFSCMIKVDALAHDFLQNSGKPDSMAKITSMQLFACIILIPISSHAIPSSAGEG